MGSLSKQELDAMAEEAVIDAYGQDEQTAGFAIMIGDNLSLPFTTVVLGVEVTVIGVQQSSESAIAAVCRRGRDRQRIDVLDLPLPSPAPRGAEWIEAWRHWNR
jgi:hypothetical protein